MRWPTGTPGVVHSRRCYSSSAATQSMDWGCSAPHRESFARPGSSRFIRRFFARWQKLWLVRVKAPGGLVTMDEALAPSERDEERWCIAELLRIKGELLLLQAGPDAVVGAEDHFRQAID